MKAKYVADTGVFVRCGGPNAEKYQQLRRAVRQAGISLLIPRRVYLELGGEPDDEPYPSSTIPWQEGIDEGWIVVADELEYANPLVSGIMTLLDGISQTTQIDRKTTSKKRTLLLSVLQHSFSRTAKLSTLSS